MNISTDNANVTIEPVETLTPEEFAAKYLPALQAAEAEPETPENYFVHNMETGKLELHFAKDAYLALSADDKKRIKEHFLWGRRSGCWISRCKDPNTAYARRVAVALGLYDAGKTGERMSFADQMALKAERAERRAERYDLRAENAEKRGEALQAPINSRHGDISFFTQPNINTSAGRAFTRQRERMWQSFLKGIEEFNKSAYWKDRAAVARGTAKQKGLQDRAFVARRIAEREKDLRTLRKNVECYQLLLDKIDSQEKPADDTALEALEKRREKVLSDIDHWMDRIEVKLDELGFYQDCLDALGGVTFGPENIKPGYIIALSRHPRYHDVVVSTGPKNFTCRDEKGGIAVSYPYAEIERIVRAVEAPPESHPFKTGETFTCNRWNPALGDHGRVEEVTYTVIRVTDKNVTLKVGDEKPIVRKPRKSHLPSNADRWYLGVTDMSGGTWYKDVSCNQ